MTITITIEAATAAEARAEMAMLIGGLQQKDAARTAGTASLVGALPEGEKAFTAPEHPIPGAQEEPKRTRGKKGIAPVTDSSAPIDIEPLKLPPVDGTEGNGSGSTADAAETTSEASAPAAGEGKAAGEMDYADVGNVLLQLTRMKGRDAAISVLNEFGVDNARKLDKEKWPLLVAAAKSKMG